MNKVCSFIRYKAKEGCEDEFLAELKAANLRNSRFLSWKIASLGDREFIETLVYEDIEKLWVRKMVEWLGLIVLSIFWSFMTTGAEQSLFQA